MVSFLDNRLDYQYDNLFCNLVLLAVFLTMAVGYRMFFKM